MIVLKYFVMIHFYNLLWSSQQYSNLRACTGSFLDRGKFQRLNFFSISAPHEGTTSSKNGECRNEQQWSNPLHGTSFTSERCFWEHRVETGRNPARRLYRLMESIPPAGRPFEPCDCPAPRRA